MDGRAYMETGRNSPALNWSRKLLRMLPHVPVPYSRNLYRGTSLVRKRPLPWDNHVALGKGLLWGPRGMNLCLRLRCQYRGTSLTRKRTA